MLIFKVEIAFEKGREMEELPEILRRLSRDIEAAPNKREHGCYTSEGRAVGVVEFVQSADVIDVSPL